MRDKGLARFARLYGIDTSEAEKPLAAYSDVDDFFTRRLRPGLRPIDPSEDSVVSPADGTVIESGLVTDGHLIQAKGVSFKLDELLADTEAAKRLNGGAYLITYLSPRDYHRVHAPVGGAVIGWHHVPGTLFPVGSKSVVREPRLFVSNERLVTLIQGRRALGLCAVVMVAAVGVGHITAAYDQDIATHSRSFRRAKVRHARYDEPRPIAKGGEIGTFHLGSTTIVVFEPGRVNLSSFVSGDKTNMGATIGRVSTQKTAALTETG
ncbi:MAG: phosphatidylserine decarboxylase [Deltaproteobacteria bacterium]|nr:phosphatidylserine decarboxylase [Deltaproteobacteria bacterium]